MTISRGCIAFRTELARTFPLRFDGRGLAIELASKMERREERVLRVDTACPQPDSSLAGAWATWRSRLSTTN